MSSSLRSCFPHDFEHIFNQTAVLWEKLRGQRIFITGGTGFFGCWLLESFLWMNQQCDLKASAVVLSRNPVLFQKQYPHFFLDSSLTFQTGAIDNFEFPSGDFAYLIHAALGKGTQHVLDFAKHCHAQGILLTSSGAVYGRKPEAQSFIAEDDLTRAFLLISIHLSCDKNCWRRVKIATAYAG